jgi:hypothetical protein
VVGDQPCRRVGRGTAAAPEAPAPVVLPTSRVAGVEPPASPAGTVLVGRGGAGRHRHRRIADQTLRPPRCRGAHGGDQAGVQDDRARGLGPHSDRRSDRGSGNREPRRPRRLDVRHLAVRRLHGQPRPGQGRAATRRTTTPEADRCGDRAPVTLLCGGGSSSTQGASRDQARSRPIRPWPRDRPPADRSLRRGRKPSGGQERPSKSPPAARPVLRRVPRWPWPPPRAAHLLLGGAGPYPGASGSVDGAHGRHSWARIPGSWARWSG